MPGDYQAFSDEKLLRLVRQNDSDAFGELSSRYLWLIRSKAGLFRGASAPEQEDLVQEGLLGLYLAACSYTGTGGAAFRTYASVCVYNRMSDALRRYRSSKNRALNESLSLDGDELLDLPSRDAPEDMVEERERFRSLLRQVGKKLTPLERKALLLYLSGCKRADIPERSGMDLKAFDNAIYRVRGKLKCAGRG